jgi:molecular chaperone GrpE
MRENSEHLGKQRERDDSPEEASTDAAEEIGLVEDAALWKDRWQRAAADPQNLRKRTAREIAMEIRRDRDELLGEFMKVVDNLERALGTEQSEHNAWYDGMVAIHDQMLDLLRRNGAVPFCAAGDQFDPNRHEAVGKMEMPGFEAGVILEVMERGYEAEDGTIIRPAKVIVAQAPAG